MHIDRLGRLGMAALVGLAAGVVCVGPSGGAAPAPLSELTGLWEAQRRFGPEVRGPLLVHRRGAVWQAEIAGRSAPASVDGELVTFELPGDEGSFRGHLEAGGERLAGHWIQPSTPVGGPYASPVVLTRVGADLWRGAVSPVEQVFRLFLMVSPEPDGSLRTVLRNPERNVGFYQYPAERLVRDGESVRLHAAAGDDGNARVLAEGRLDRESGLLSIAFPSRGGTYDFRRVPAEEASDFHPRRRPGAAYVYTPPPTVGDGWQTASLEDAGISRPAIERAMQAILDTPQAPRSQRAVHAILVARHGKLVLEEYFHGEHRDKPHDTRSAGKSLASDVAGAAIQAGLPVAPSTPVYETMRGAAPPASLEAGRRALTLEHLLTMSSGLDCDEEDESSAGNEENLRDPDVYAQMLALRMVRDPGAKAVYCSGGAHLALGVVARAAGRHTLELFHALFAEPLGIERYFLGVTPLGEAYMGGGARLLPRDFLKLPQVHLDGGTWNGRRVFTREWSQRATSPLVKFSETSRASYGYLWWVYDFPYRGRTVRGFFASGNGGQEAIGIPGLDLAIVTFAGHYNDWDTGTEFLREFIPTQILAAVEDLPGRTGKPEDPQ